MSDSWIENKAPTIKILTEKRDLLPENFTALDVGMGAGDFGKLLRENIKGIKKLVGLEVYHPTIVKDSKQQNHYYTSIIITELVEHIKSGNLVDYDLIMAMDVIEHLPRKDGEFAIVALAKHCRLLLVSVPLTREAWKQGRTINPYDEHKTYWQGEEIQGLGGYYVGGKNVGVFWFRGKYYGNLI